ncbi:MAG: phytanoyl-CoA dioxygenase family protein [Pseudomonadota bacterium]
MMTPLQRYQFDAFGYIVVPNALSAQDVARLKDTLRQPTEQWEPVDKQDGPLHWDPIWRALLDFPTLSPIIEALVGNHEFRRRFEARKGYAPYPTYRLDHINVHTHVANGYPGSVLHGGWQNAGGCQYFRYHDGEFHNGLLAVAVELFDTHPNGGGFCCIPGTHKANLELPDGWRDLSKLADTGIASLLHRVPANAGDAIIFTEALTHGTLPWTVDAQRQTLFYKFSPHGTTWAAEFFDPDDFRHYDDMDARKLAVLEPPNARYPGRVTRPAGA